MPSRWGRWRDSYDPDANLGLPRPFRLGESVRPGRARHQLFIPDGRQVARRRNPLQEYKEPTFFTLPHKHKRLKGIAARRGVVVELDKALARSLARQGLINEGKGAGEYVKWVADYTYDPLSGQMRPVYKYAKVPDFKGLEAAGESGQRAILIWLWKYARTDDQYGYWGVAKRLQASRQDILQKSRHEYQAYYQQWQAEARRLEAYYHEFRY